MAVRGFAASRAPSAPSKCTSPPKATVTVAAVVGEVPGDVPDGAVGDAVRLVGSVAAALPAVVEEGPRAAAAGWSAPAAEQPTSRAVQASGATRR